MWNQKPCFRFEIDNLSKKKAAIKSKVFVSGGCEWYLNLHPKGDGRCDDHVSLYLYVAKPKSLGRGWERSAKFYFVLLNQSDKELYKSPIGKKRSVFCAKDPAWGFPKTLPLSKFPEKGFLDKDRLIIEVYIKVFKAFDGVGVVSETNKTMDIHGFQVLASQVTPVRKIFAEHPDLAEDFKPKNQVVKTVYMNVLLNLIEMLHKPSLKYSETELRNADSELSELMEVGFKLDWLKSKLDEVSLRKRDGSCLQQVSKNMEQRKLDYKAYVASFFLDMKKTDDADGSRVQQLEERVEDVSLERKKTDDSARLQQLEERLKNLEKMELGFKLDCFKSKLEEVSLERKTARDADGSRVQQLDERLKNLELMELGFNLSCIKSKLEEVSLKRNKSGDADGSLAKQLEEHLKNLELLVLDLKFELDKEKAKSCDDEFLLVDEVA